MTEPAILVLRKPVKLATTDAHHIRPAAAVTERFRTAKARSSFQPVEQLIVRLDRAGTAQACA
jgi:hypothetical protein